MGVSLGGIKMDCCINIKKNVTNWIDEKRSVRWQTGSVKKFSMKSHIWLFIYMLSIRQSTSK
jgi:hypothetical protein